MDTLTKKISLLLLFAAFSMASTMTYAKTNADGTSNDLASLINIAGKQRMLSQRIAKAYFFYGKGIRPEKTRKQLLDSIREFNIGFDTLQSQVSTQGVQDMLVYIDMAKSELGTLIKAPYSKENASLVLDYTETMLEGSQDIVNRLEESSALKKEAIVNLAGRQRMLTQRIAKYYMAYQAGFKDHNTATQLKAAVAEFEQAHAILRNAKSNTPAISKDLTKVDKLWNIVVKFYTDVERGGLPVIVLATSDDIMSSMDRVTSMYVDIFKS